MARGFGATYGSGSSDKIDSTYTSETTLSTYLIHAFRHGAGVNGYGRCFEHGNSGTNYTGLAYATFYTQMYFARSWNDTDTFWTINSLPSADAWHIFSISYDEGATTNDPTIYVDGSSAAITERVTPTGSVTNINGTTLRIGNAFDSGQPWDGMLAEFAKWNVILTAAEHIALSKGASPLSIRPASLVEYIPMVRENVSRKFAAPTLTGTIVQSHPTVIMPRRSRMRKIGIIPDTTRFGIRGFADTAF